MPHVRGIHKTGGIEALHVVRAKTQPGTLTTKLARLDHQRGLLERQLAVWTEKQQVTRERLTLVEKQMAEVGRLVRAFTCRIAPDAGGRPPRAGRVTARPLRRKSRRSIWNIEPPADGFPRQRCWS